MKMIGGQALIEGVMMRSPDKISSSCRLPNGKIKTKVKKHKSWVQRHPMLDIPIVRGACHLLDMMIIGLEALTWSADQQQEKDEEKLKKSEIAWTMAISLVGAIVLFIGIPYVVARLFSTPETTGFHAIDGVARLFVFMAYILLIGQMKEIKRVFEYHGAEHKTVHCYEAKKKLTVANVQKYPTEHPRCGTTFIVIVIAVSIIVFTFLRTPHWYYNIGLRILFIPIIAGLSYEFLRFGGKHFKNPLVKWLVMPGIWMQSLTTRQPDDKQVQVAIQAMKKAL